LPLFVVFVPFPSRRLLDANRFAGVAVRYFPFLPFLLFSYLSFIFTKSPIPCILAVLLYFTRKYSATTFKFKKILQETSFFSKKKSITIITALSQGPLFVKEDARDRSPRSSQARKRIEDASQRRF